LLIEREWLMRNKPPFLLNSVSWRWDLISSLVEQKKDLTRTHADPLLRKGYFFFRRYIKASDTTQHMLLMQDYRDLYEAYATFMDWRSERWLIEAAVCADVPSREIAEFVGLRTAVVDLYESIFFDIRPKLSARGYVLNRIFLPAVQRGLLERDHDLMYKSLAYFSGWDICREFMAGGILSEKARHWATQAISDGLLRKGYAAVQRLEVNNFNAVEVIGLCLKLKEIETVKGSSMAQDEAMKTLGQLLENCATQILPDGGLGGADEPRVNELMGNATMVEYQKSENPAR
jgi:hypothetical protein